MESFYTARYLLNRIPSNILPTAQPLSTNELTHPRSPNIAQDCSMFKRKRDLGEEEAGSSVCLLAKAVKNDPIPAPVQRPPDSEEEGSHSLRAVRSRPGGRLDRRILYVRVPRPKKKGRTMEAAAVRKDEDEEKQKDDEKSDEDDEEEGEDEDNGEGQNEDNGEGQNEDNEEEEEEHEEDQLLILTHLDDPSNEDCYVEVTEEPLEHRLLGIGRQTKWVPPEQSPLACPLSREREAALVALQVEPFETPKAVGFPTSTGAQKHTVPKGVSSDAAYTPNLECIIDNTGAQKGIASTGVDPDTEYAGDVMLFPTVDCVMKGMDLQRVLIFNCDEDETAMDAKILAIVNDQPAVPKEGAAASLHFALPLDIRGTQAFTSTARKVVRLAFSSLKTSEEPTFERGTKLPLKKHEAFGMVLSIQEEHATLPLPNDSPPLESSASTAHPVTNPNISLPLQVIIQGSGIPRSLRQLEIIVEGLAEGLELAPEPSYLDMRGGKKFDLDKEIARYNLPFHGCHREPVDYTGRLLSLLNIHGRWRD
ncbi:hypothetical protein HBI56_109750 [Parastagonospora nodorum]|uniref:Uncharacterized protein n=1 Tax=Phaeosphaeria nodorum (strain SN15 / ATCC MYA-4574 / FGSC 10173) TaxID=321614 RepID=A0A7U2EU94_PHANO|nr:hypothetical protein HBH56_042300 [Parastagonospora nodorum]QRC92942.1 hypothetical protein JI435_080140 [Parastagonospora nodorum SN15]KAH3932923.1 hypothetical protein HBH54_070050 [Parastagonospora nodorum]KAH3943502.1 hypothetical protein HBH53_174220 [Parastagonospora nodorum]KAH3961816.1 hypothetical protein HBH52_229440 [Parastagonospora nodorum]